VIKNRRTSVNLEINDLKFRKPMKERASKAKTGKPLNTIPNENFHFWK
jgi:hypothetical protein